MWHVQRRLGGVWLAVALLGIGDPTLAVSLAPGDSRLVRTNFAQIVTPGVNLSSDPSLAGTVVADATRSFSFVVTTEFGRPPEFDSGGGRGHQGSAFTCVLAGGGLKHRGAYGETDELGKKIVSDPVSVADFFATIHAAVGIDYSKNLYDGDRPVPITDMGQPIAKLFF